MASKDTVRLAAVGDLHCTKTSQGAFQPLLTKISESADILALCGDLTDYGTPEEAHVLARELLAVKVPIVGVLGNHDYESGAGEEVKRILRDAGVIILDGDAGVIILDGEACEIHGIGFAGVKGFCSGFGRCTLGAWGEEAIKAFVREAVSESLKLEAALARLRTDQRIALLHYAPIAGTVVGEPVDIYPFLGTSRLEEPLARYPVSAVFHGHAHSGSPEGQTHTGVPVYNVAMPMLRRKFPDMPAFKILEIKVTQDGEEMNPINPNVLNLTQNVRSLGA
jgi:Icc-related predicted phosphoesterase